MISSKKKRVMAGASGHVDGANIPTLVDGWARYPTVLERYYTTYTTSNGQHLHVHSNGCVESDLRSLRRWLTVPTLARLSVIGLAKTHPLMQPPMEVKRVEFRAHDGKNLLEAEVSGKKKGGLQRAVPSGPPGPPSSSPSSSPSSPSSTVDLVVASPRRFANGLIDLMGDDDEPQAWE